MEKKKKAVENGHMANSLEEVKELGKQMEKMRDGQELARDHRVQDPRQFDTEHKHDDEK